MFNLEHKCIQLLDDGVERDSPTALWEQYNFGTAPELLFKPCNSDSEGIGSSSSDDSCFAYSVGGITFQRDPIIRLEKDKQISEDYSGNADLISSSSATSASFSNSTSAGMSFPTFPQVTFQRSINETVDA